MVIHQGGLFWVCVLSLKASLFFLALCGFCCILLLVYFFGCVFSVGVFGVAVPRRLADLSSIVVGFSVCILHQRMSHHLRRSLLVRVSLPVSVLQGLPRQGTGIPHCQRKRHCRRVSLRVSFGFCLCLLGSFCTCGFSCLALLWLACRANRKQAVTTSKRSQH